MRSAQLPGGSLGRPLRTDCRRWVCKAGKWLTERRMVLWASESAGAGGGGHRPLRGVQQRERSPEVPVGLAGGREVCTREGRTYAPGAGTLARR